MLTQQQRRKFIDYFKSRGHAHVSSSAVVPHDDPTLLFTNAGMNQFKEVFLGGTIRDYTRAVTCQKCIRAGGKHNDLENVGHTARHLTFFEMLGNFSFGDYFKKEAIRFAWELSTEVFGFEASRIWPTVFRDDDEAFELWTSYVPAERITRLGEKDNFWAMGDTGPCGPCSELFYDRGTAYGAATSPADDTAGTRFLEFWNLVFMQYNCEVDGTMVPLPKPCVDTGAGLERIVALKLDVESLFDTDLLLSLISAVEEISGISYDNVGGDKKAAFRVIADHMRSLSFAIADGAQPSNVERGYVLRKILRRAVRYGRMLGFDEPFLAKLLPRLVGAMGGDYPELTTASDRIAEILTLEEEAFLRTLQRGGNMLQQVMLRAESHDRKISGDDAFKLKDTYGLPIEEIALMAKDSNLTVEMSRFEALEAEARERSRRQQKGVQQQAGGSLYAAFAESMPPVRFHGYTEMATHATVTGLLVGDTFVDTIKEGMEGIVILDRTPFYAEMGGQVGDTGVITGSEDSAAGKSLFTVAECFSPYKGVIAHGGKVITGSISVGDSVIASTDAERRRAIANNHTATHLLHWALQHVVGPHVRQAGSVVDAERLRFDFSHHKALTDEEIATIEELVNGKIRANVAVAWYELPYEEAQRHQEIKQFFGDKYGATVRVVDIEFSKELCGGTHAARTGDIGYFVIAKEGSIAAGVRRIEAVTGVAAESLRHCDSKLLTSLAMALKVNPQQLPERIEKLLEENKVLGSEIKKMRHEQLTVMARELATVAEIVGGVKFVAAELPLDGEGLRQCADALMSQLGTGVAVVGTREGGRCQVIARVSDDIAAGGRLKASDLAKAVGVLIEGSGGGKVTAAQAGGKAVDKLPEALEAVRRMVAGY